MFTGTSDVSNVVERWRLLYYRITTQWRTENSFKLPSSSSVRKSPPVSPIYCAITDWLFLGSLTTTGGVEANKCSADAMSRCTDPLKVVTDNKDLGFATSKDELDEMCPWVTCWQYWQKFRLRRLKIIVSIKNNLNFSATKISHCHYSAMLLWVVQPYGPLCAIITCCTTNANVL